MNDDPISRIEAALEFAGSQGWHPFHCDDICALLDRLKAAEAVRGDAKLLRQALEALEADNSKLWPRDSRTSAITALRKRLGETK